MQEVYVYFGVQIYQIYKSFFLKKKQPLVWMDDVWKIGKKLEEREKRGWMVVEMNERNSQ